MIWPAEVFVSAIVYVPREARSAALSMVPEILTALSWAFKEYEVILVNDSGAVLDKEQLASAGRNIVIVDLAYEHGRERAMTAGDDLAVGDFIFEFDYPLEYVPTNLLGRAYETAGRERADIVALTCRESQAWASRAFYRLLRRLGVTSHQMATESVRLVSRRALNSMLKERRSMRFRKLMYLFSGFRYVREEDGRLNMVKDQGTLGRFSLAVDLLASMAQIGSSLSRILSVVFVLISAAMAVYAVTVRLIGFPVAEGWTTLAVFMAMGFGGVFGVLWLISRMVEITLEEIQNTTPYKVREVTRLDNR